MSCAAGAVEAEAAGTDWLCPSCSACAVQNEIPSATTQPRIRQRHICFSRLTIWVAPRGGTSHWSVVARVVSPGILLPARFRRMASIRTIKRGEVCSRTRSLMASLASCGLMRNFPIGMGKCRARPRSSCMACRARACRRKTIAGVIRNRPAQRRCTLPVSCVAAVAIGRWHS